jgi:hypothetical protein
MKILIAIVALVLLISACGSGPGERTAADDELYREAAMNLVQTFSSELTGALESAIEERGIDGAIDVCQLEGPRIAAAHSVNGWSIKRVTDRFRNPDNAANPEELAILARFLEKGAPSYIEEWDSSGTVATYRYYHPIRTSELCLNCHGSQERIGEGVIEKVRLVYPDDHATGYEENELRGMFVVRGHWPEGKEAAQAVVNIDD